MANNPSDANVASIRDRLRESIGDVRDDQRDYGGHRAQALNDMSRAERELDLAVEWDRSHGNDKGGTTASDRNIESVLDGLGAAATQLSADQRDYGGHRERAVDDVSKAINELRAALRYENQH